MKTNFSQKYDFSNKLIKQVYKKTKIFAPKRI